MKNLAYTKLIENITKSNQDSQNKKLRLFAKYEIEIKIKIKILEHQKKLFHKLKAIYNDVDNSVLTLSTLILAVETISKKENEINLNTIRLRSKNNKAKIKRQKILSYWSIVKTLKLKEEMSFRQISLYLKKYHKFEIAHSTIHNLWNELENNKKEENKC